MPGNIVLMLCEHYRREAETLLDQEDFADTILATFPGRCNRPPLSREELEATLSTIQDPDRVHVFGAACCLAKIEDSPRQRPRWCVHRLPQCFNMIADRDITDRYLREGAYLVTPGWLADWPACIRRMGLNQETARMMFRETTSRILLLDSGIDPKSTLHLEAFADFVGRPCRTIPVGISCLHLQLTRTIITWRLETQRREASEASRKMLQQSADYAMAVDLLGQLARTTEEKTAVEAMLDVFKMLFAAERVLFLSFAHGKPDRLYTHQQTILDPRENETTWNHLAGIREESVWIETGRGFCFPVVSRGEIQGVVAIEDIAFPEYRNHYLNLALNIGNVCMLPIDNARKYEKLQHTEKQLREANDALLRIATTDALTGIANRRAFDDYMQREWKRMLRANTPLSLILCDIDYFKKYNDLYGHQEGDACLHDVAQALAGCAVRPGDFVARYGGEEFSVILPDTPLEGALHIAEQMRSAVRGLNRIHDGSEIDRFVTLSLGVAQGIHSPKASPEDLLIAADTALYKAKGQGRNRVVPADR